ncbi:MAG TPA: TIGR00153 family protein [Methanobacteriaceae archaeon]|jgi:predicted phosphate transport protein (TIGR00153 family)|nr:TIGR00153 family protein [Methanobacteriaceae archaeon]
MSLFGRESRVEKHFREHAHLVYECVLKLQELMPLFYQGDFDSLEDKVHEMSLLEHQADEIRRIMEIEFFKGAFLPFDREDRIILAELVDSVADMTQETAYGICLSQVQFPVQFEEDYQEMVDAVCETIRILKESLEMLDEDLAQAIAKAHEVEVNEEAVDRIERRIIKKLYNAYRKGDFGILKLIELKNIATRLGEIADRAEDASDRVLIMVAKRRG